MPSAGASGGLALKLALGLRLTVGVTASPSSGAPSPSNAARSTQASSRTTAVDGGGGGHAASAHACSTSRSAWTSLAHDDGPAQPRSRASNTTSSSRRRRPSGCASPSSAPSSAAGSGGSSAVSVAAMSATCWRRAYSQSETGSCAVRLLLVARLLRSLFWLAARSGITALETRRAPCATKEDVRVAARPSASVHPPATTDRTESVSASPRCERTRFVLIDAAAPRSPRPCKVPKMPM
eukprot:5090434-Prymnesium_polylepis.1